jgi:hypothetical protein
MRRLMTSMPALFATSASMSSLLFVSTGLGSTGVIGNGASSRNGTAVTPR